MSLMLILASGCSSDNIQQNPADSDAWPENTQPAKILCAAFAEYDWTRQIIGDNPGNITLTLLNDSGMDMHSYQPSVADMVEIAGSDLIIFTGGDSEFWIEDGLISSQDDSASRQSLSMMEIFEHSHELADCYSADDHDDHDDHEGHGHEEEDEHEGHVHSTDEHLWLSLKMAPAFISKIAEAVATLDPDNSDYYRSNASTYIDKIHQLSARYEEAAAKANHRTILFADRYPFKYLLEDYGLDHVAAFPGCSAETEASFETILSLSDTVDHLDLGAVAILHKSKPDLAHTIIKNSGHKDAEILILDSMQSVTKSDIQAGTTYLSIMEHNLEVLQRALS